VYSICGTVVSNKKSPHGTVERTAHAFATALQHVRVDHGRFDALMYEEFLDGTNVVAMLQGI
jgi:hypothetical protein